MGTVSSYWVGLLATYLTGQIMRCFLIDTINFEKHFIKLYYSLVTFVTNE